MLYRIFASLVIGLSAVGVAYAQSAFPTHTITVVISSGVGGSSDIATRIVANKMATLLKGNVIV